MILHLVLVGGANSEHWSKRPLRPFTLKRLASICKRDA